MGATTTETKANGKAKESQLVNMEDVLRETQRNAMMRPELLQMRMENETIMTECRLRPRDMLAIKEQLAELLDTFPEFADDSIYRKPVGKESDEGEQKYAEGLSVRAAEALAEAYGYNRVRADVTPIDEFNAKVDATFTDFQTGRIWQDGGVICRKYKDRYGKIIEMNIDRFYDLKCKAEASKRVREVILRCVNPALKAWFRDACERKLSERLTDDAVNQIVDKFKEKGVGLGQLNDLLGQPLAMGWTKTHRLTLLGVWNAIKDGETTFEAVFEKKQAEKDKEREGRNASIDDKLAAAQKPADTAPKSAPPETPVVAAPVAKEPEPTSTQPPDSSVYNQPLEILRPQIGALMASLGRAGVKDLGDLDELLRDETRLKDVLSNGEATKARKALAEAVKAG